MTQSREQKRIQFLAIERGRDGALLEGSRTPRGAATLTVELKSGDYLDGMTRVGVTLTPVQVRELVRFLAPPVALSTPRGPTP